jgi:hypothetical protein
MYTRASLDEPDTWHSFRLECKEKGYPDLNQVLRSLEPIEFNAMSDTNPVVPRIQIREHITDVLEHISLHIREGLERYDPMLLSK